MNNREWCGIFIELIIACMTWQYTVVLFVREFQEDHIYLENFGQSWRIECTLSSSTQSEHGQLHQP